MQKSKTLIYSFLSGILYVFGISQNPAINIRNIQMKKSDSENLASDWYKVGKDINNSYEQFKKSN